MNKKTILTSIIAAVVTVSAFAAEDPTPAQRKTVTSVKYVTDQLATKQNTIPATGTNSATAGTTVVMYTGTAGTIGERALYTNGTSYTAGTDANKLVTASALDGAVNNLPTMQTSKLTCANQADGCTLWTIENQEVYGDED